MLPRVLWTLPCTVDTPHILGYLSRCPALFLAPSLSPVQVSIRDRRGRNVMDYAVEGSGASKVLQQHLKELESKATELQVGVGWQLLVVGWGDGGEGGLAELQGGLEVFAARGTLRRV